MPTQSTQRTKRPIYIELPVEANPTDPGPFHAISAGLATGIYPTSAWSNVAFFVHCKTSKVTNPWWRKCETWNQAVHAVSHQSALHPSQFDSESEKLAPRPPRSVMAAEYWQGVWNSPVVLILEPEDANHIHKWAGAPVESPTVEFAIRSAANLGRPLFATHRMDATPIFSLPEPRPPPPGSTGLPPARRWKEPSGRLIVLPHSQPQPLSQLSLPQVWPQLNMTSTVEGLRSIPGSVETDLASPPPPSTLRGGSETEVEDWVAPASERSLDYSHASSACSSPSLGGPENPPFNTIPPLGPVQRLKAFEQSHERFRVLGQMRTSDLMLEADINAQLVVLALDGWSFTSEGINAIRAAMAKFN